MPRADRYHDGSRLLKALLDPSRPAGVAAREEGGFELGAVGEVGVEASRDPGDVARRPAFQHVGELAAHLLGLADRALEEGALGGL